MTRLRIQTQFGEFDADPRDILDFPAGLPGFERCRRFAVLSSVAMAPLQCLHSVTGEATFLAIDPRLVVPQYDCKLAETDRARLGADQHTLLLWLSLVTVDEENNASVNLRAPIVINPARMRGYQVVPDQAEYPLQYPLP